MTAAKKRRTLSPMIRLYLVLLSSFILTSCVTKPPVQAMAEARAAVQSVRPFYANQIVRDTKAYRYYQSAEQSLRAATEALDKKKYDIAKRKAHEAKSQARLAAKFK